MHDLRRSGVSDRLNIVRGNLMTFFSVKEATNAILTILE